MFRCLLDLSYIIFLNPAYEYAGFSLDVNVLNYVLSWFAYVISLLFLRSRIKRVSDYFLMTFVLFVIAPLTSIYGLNDWGAEPVVVTVLSFVLFVFIVRSSLVKVPSAPVVKGGERIAIGGSVALVLFLLIWYVYSGAVFNLNFAKVYEFRRDNAELAAQGVLAYLNGWIYGVFSIFSLAYFLHKKNWMGVVFIVLAQVVFYGFSSHKSVLFSLVIVFGTWYWFSKSDKAYIVPLGLCGIVVFSLVLYFLFDEVVGGSLFIRRVFYVPAYLTYQYFEFFNESAKVVWSNSFLSGYFVYPYELSVPLTIGAYIGQPSASANNGFVSMGFAHLGCWGVFIYTVVFAYVLRVIDVLTKKLGVLWLGLVVTIVPLRAALISTDLLTTLLTHGLFISILLVLLVRNNKNYAL